MYTVFIVFQSLRAPTGAIRGQWFLRLPVYLFLSSFLIPLPWAACPNYQSVCSQLAEVSRKFRQSNDALSDQDPLHPVAYHFGGFYGLKSKHCLHFNSFLMAYCVQCIGQRTGVFNGSESKLLIYK